MSQSHYNIEKEIRATPDQVWPVMADVSRWPEWTPTIVKVVPLTPGPMGVDSKVRIHQPKLPPAFWRVTEWSPGKSFTWVSVTPGVRVTARHVVEPSSGGCRVILSLDYQGLLGEMVARLTHSYNRRYLELEAEGLKAHCEALAKGLVPPTVEVLKSRLN